MRKWGSSGGWGDRARERDSDREGDRDRGYSSGFQEAHSRLLNERGAFDDRNKRPRLDSSAASPAWPHRPRQSYDSAVQQPLQPDNPYATPSGNSGLSIPTGPRSSFHGPAMRGNWGSPAGTRGGRGGFGGGGPGRGGGFSGGWRSGSSTPGSAGYGGMEEPPARSLARKYEEPRSPTVPAGLRARTGSVSAATFDTASDPPAMGSPFGEARPAALPSHNLSMMEPSDSPSKLPPGAPPVRPAVARRLSATIPIHEATSGEHQPSVPSGTSIGASSVSCTPSGPPVQPASTVTYEPLQFAYALNPSLEAQIYRLAHKRLASLREITCSKKRSELNAALYSLKDIETELQAARERTKATDMQLQNASESADVFALEANKREAEAATWSTQMMRSI
ncbi:hypothetical protein K437DRAFT_254442 [Tilletiaria anomala UBC 951]|uniref:Uncharacterized protein n=1 Tax=Tilletiaria anomala (strain ATCC 24038 / CBS 436.72 / UBC 951) TaxID=1037660 RepID=A0A066WER4_TILAU|nr:uncharacterized protein K437DRAFT_254442 [Tilletiaria anomala UBC 951]KDN52251.1 hypothetical protein K437DRAFT_254442 [Tilletiaria anomala UBC 951]